MVVSGEGSTSSTRKVLEEEENEKAGYKEGWSYMGHFSIDSYKEPILRTSDQKLERGL
jgi:hypothetical protein